MQLQAYKHGASPAVSSRTSQQRTPVLLRPQGHGLQRDSSCVVRHKQQRASPAVTAAGATQTQESAGSLRQLHPPPNPQGAYHLGQIKVSDLHTVHYYQYGNPQGLPAVFLHGGPGAAAWPNHARFFDLRVWRVVLLDQRGCGASTPRGCLVDNSTEALVSDLEALRAHLEIPSWLVLGGSWGVALGLAYASAFPERVSGLVLRGICMMRPQEIDWMYRPGGASLLRPMGWAKFVESLPEDLRQGSVLHGYLRQLTSSNASVRDAAARSWMDWGFSVGGGSSKAALVWDGSEWSWNQHPLPQSPKNWGARPSPTPLQQQQQQQQNNQQQNQQQHQQQPQAATNGVQRWFNSRKQQSGRGRKGGSSSSSENGSGSKNGQNVGGGGGGGLVGGSGVNGGGNGRGIGVSSGAQSNVAAATSTSGNTNGSNGSDSNGSDSDGSSGRSSSSSQEAETLEAALQFMGDNAMPSTTAQALLECAYSAAYGFGLHRHPLLAPDRISALQAHGVRCIAIQGEMDLICPPANVWDLHKAWPQMQVVIVPEAGHSQYDPRISHELVCAVEHMQRDIQGR